MFDQERRLGPIRYAAGRRLGIVHQLVLQIAQLIFDDLEVTSARDWPAVLRAAPDAALDLTTPANIYPPRSRGQRLHELGFELSAAVADVMTFTAAGVLPEEGNQVDLGTRALMNLIQVLSMTDIMKSVGPPSPVRSPPRSKTSRRSFR